MAFPIPRPARTPTRSHRGLLHGEDEAVVDVQRTRHGTIGAVAWRCAELILLVIPMGKP